MYGWKFWQFDPARDTLQDPITSEFFASDAISDSADALVRESIQNSLDARIAGNSATVYITLEEAPDERYYREMSDVLFGSLSKHVLAPRNGLQEPADPILAAPYVAIEDFGTSGLEGNAEPHVPADGETNDFFAFFRAEGWTNKGDESMGRWGIGKTVFPRSSQINGFFGWTIRDSDRRSLLMGRCILKGHRVDHSLYLPNGHFGVHSSKGVSPIDDAEFIRSFKGAFRLRRRSEPGLSVVVPHVDLDQITQATLVRSVVKNYFYPVLTGELTVHVIAGERSLTIDRTTLREHAAGLDAEYFHVMSMAEWSLRPEAAAPIGLGVPTSQGTPSWDDVQISPVLRTTLRELYLAGAPLSLRAEVVVKPKGHAAAQSHMDILIRRVGDEASGRPVFVREGIVISDAKGKRSAGIVAIVHASHGALATLLGDAENVAHTIWSKDTKGFREKYTYGAGYLDYVRSAPAAIVKKLMEGEEEEDKLLLERFFSLDAEPEPEDEAADEGRDPEAGNPTGEPVPPLAPRLPRYSIVRIAGGFVVTPGSSESPLWGLSIRMAYDVRRGNPLKKYHPADFVLGSSPTLVTESRGLKVISAASNVLRVQVLEKDFKLQLEGFDARRDLYLKVDPIEGGADDSQTS